MKEKKKLSWDFERVYKYLCDMEEVNADLE